MEKHSKYIIPALLLVYVLEVYGSLILSKYNIIDVLTWCLIHHIGICILLCSFLFLLKDKIKPFIYSIATSFFVGRLLTQLKGGFELRYEMINFISITVVLYFLVKYKDWIIKTFKKLWNLKN